MRDRELLASLCAATGFGPTAAWAARFRQPDFPWERFVALASHFKLTPVLHWRLGERGLAGSVPAEVLAYFEAAGSLMRDRNRRELQQLGRVARSLNRCGVRPVLLKGAASLVAGTYPESAGRFLSDIDLLVPQGAIEECVTVLEAAGYRADPATVGRFRQRRACFHHYPRLFHPQEPAGIELHIALGRGETLPRAAEVLSDAVAQSWRGAELSLPAPRHRLLHCALHGLRDYRAGQPIALRQLLEFCLIRQAWPEPWRPSCRRQAQALRRYGAFAQLLLGFADPQAGPAGALDRVRVAAHLVRLIELPWLGAMATALALPGQLLPILMAQPSSLARLTRAAFYRDRMGELRRAGRGPARRIGRRTDAHQLHP